MPDYEAEKGKFDMKQNKYMNFMEAAIDIIDDYSEMHWVYHLIQRPKFARGLYSWQVEVYDSNGNNLNMVN